MSELRREFSEALRLREEGNLVGAASILSRLGQGGDATAAVFAVLGDVQWDIGRSSDAIQSFRRATELSPHSEDASLGLFHTLFEAGRQEDAFNELRRFLSVADSAEYQRLLEELRDGDDT